MIKTYVIEEKDGQLIEHLPGDLLPYQNGKKTARQLSKLLPSIFHVVEINIAAGKKVAYWTKSGNNFVPTKVDIDWTYTDRHIRLTFNTDLLDNNPYAKYFRNWLASQTPFDFDDASDKNKFYVKKVRKAQGYSLVDGIIVCSDANIIVEQFGTFEENELRIKQI